MFFIQDIIKTKIFYRISLRTLPPVPQGYCREISKKGGKQKGKCRHYHWLPFVCVEGLATLSTIVIFCILQIRGECCGAPQGLLHLICKIIVTFIIISYWDPQSSQQHSSLRCKKYRERVARPPPQINDKTTTFAFSSFTIFALTETQSQICVTNTKAHDKK